MPVGGRRTHAPLPYSGQEVDRIERLGESYVRDSYGDDDGGPSYRFNSLGFRGAEFDADAVHRVFAFGESHAFGFGVDFEQCWPSRFVKHWTAARGVDPRDVCYLNFADAGASNASIARALISQCCAVRPDLVLVHLSDPRRSETFLGKEPFQVGPWLLEEPALRAAREAPRENGLRRKLEELVDRARHFYRYASGSEQPGPFSIDSDAHFVLDTVRNILLIQYFCQASGIRAVATLEHVQQLRAADVETHPQLGPLVAQIDSAFLCDFSIWDQEVDAQDEGQHAGPARHDAFARSFLTFQQAIECGERSARRSSRAAGALRTPTPEERRVRAFYADKPFNHWSSAEAAGLSLRANPVPDAYPDLHDLLVRRKVRTVLDSGCGDGWLAAAVALHYDLEVVGLDFTSKAVARARAVAENLGVSRRCRFVAGNLLDLRFDGRFDLVMSLGVLHHTVDARRAFEHLWPAARPGGHLYVGLYHEPGRRPFLDHFEQVLEREGEEAAFWEFRRLLPERRNSDHLRSWFYDQVLHPRESSHTLREASDWLFASDLELVSTSINGFEPFSDLERVFALEPGYRKRSQRALVKGRFFPGFFTFLARRPSGKVPSKAKVFDGQPLVDEL